MIARVASFEGINVEAAKSSMDEAEAVIRPILAGLPGYSGGLELASADGKFISISLFETMENAESAESTFDEEMPAKLGHLFRDWEGNRVSVDRYQVVGDDRR